MEETMDAYMLMPKLDEILERLDAIEDSLDEIRKAMNLLIRADKDQEYECSHCGKDIDTADKYCAGCDRRLKE